jgi:hypothetical protein
MTRLPARVGLAVVACICLAGGLAIVGQRNPKMGNAIDIGWDIVMVVILGVFAVWTWRERRFRNRVETVEAEAKVKPQLNKLNVRDFAVAFAILFPGMWFLGWSFQRAVHEPVVLQPYSPWLIFGLGLAVFGVAVSLSFPLIVRIAGRLAAALIRGMGGRGNGSA